VTSFLLNEKRSEITKIELKQRVTVLLVPNKHLETPNYKLERLRHDDPRLESLQASYTMIEEPDDEVGITRREKAKPKQEPLIKGVLPDQPAPPAPAPAPVVAPAPVAVAPVAPPVPVRTPAPAPAAGSGFFGWVSRLFGGSPAPAPAPVAAPVVATAPAAPAAAAPEKREGRRGERGGRGGERGDRGPRSGRDAPREGGREGREPREPREAREPRGEGRGGRGPRAEAAPEGAAAPAVAREERAPRNGDRNGVGRGPRPERNGTPRTEDAAIAEPQALVEGNIPAPGEALQAEGGEREGGRRRRRRGGRDRGEGRGDELRVDENGNPIVEEGTGAEPSGEGVTDAAIPATAEGDAPVEGNGERERGRRRRGGRDRQREGTEQAAEAVEGDSGQPTPATFAAAEGPADVAYAEPAPMPAPAAFIAPLATPVAEVPVPVRIEPYILPTGDLQSLAAQAGLEWVNSDAEKIRVVQEAMAAEPQPLRVPREPKRHVLADEGPLVLVETRKDLSQLKLPFEKGASAH
jgi:ribonuclease E